MDISRYSELSGITFSDINRLTSVINKSQIILESMLGYSLDSDKRLDNQYIERGKTPTECPCPDINEDTLIDPDDVEFAYRLYGYNPKDKYLLIDPASEIHAVKLVRGDITLKTLDPNEYREDYRFEFVKYLEQIKKWCGCRIKCDCVQLAVDADWLWEEGQIPDDLLYVWAEIVTYNLDEKRDIRSEVLGTHSYTRFDKPEPQFIDSNLKIIKKYMGGNGAIRKVNTI
jgi:hypothetical protein